MHITMSVSRLSKTRVYFATYLQRLNPIATSFETLVQDKVH